MPSEVVSANEVTVSTDRVDRIIISERISDNDFFIFEFFILTHSPFKNIFAQKKCAAEATHKKRIAQLSPNNLTYYEINRYAIKSMHFYQIPIKITHRQFRLLTCKIIWQFYFIISVIISQQKMQT